MKKFFLCLVLCVLMGVFPTFASTIAFPSQMVENTLFILGTYENEPISWILLGNHAEEAPLALCQYVFPEMPFSENGITDYAQSDLRAYLDGEFYTSVFTPEEQKLIVPKGSPDRGITDWMQPYPIPANEGFYLFPPSASEAREILARYNLLSGISITDKTSAGYWLRTAHQSAKNLCGVVRSDSTVTTDSVQDNHGVRPGFRMDFSSIVFVRKSFDEDYGEVGLVEKTDFNRSGEYKLSLHEATMHVDIREVAYDPNGKISVSYQNAAYPKDTYLSVIITNHRNEIRAYGRLGKVKGSSGKLAAACNFDLTDGEYTVHAFLERLGTRGKPDFVTRPISHVATVKRVSLPLPLWFWSIPLVAVLLIVVTVILQKKKTK